MCVLIYFFCSTVYAVHLGKEHSQILGLEWSIPSCRPYLDMSVSSGKRFYRTLRFWQLRDGGLLNNYACYLLYSMFHYILKDYLIDVL